MSRSGPTWPTAAAAASVWQVAHVRANSSRPVASFLVSVIPAGPTRALSLAVGDGDRDRDGEAERDDEAKAPARTRLREPGLGVQLRAQRRRARR